MDRMVLVPVLVRGTMANGVMDSHTAHSTYDDTMTYHTVKSTVTSDPIQLPD